MPRAFVALALALAVAAAALPLSLSRSSTAWAAALDGAAEAQLRGAVASKLSAASESESENANANANAGLTGVCPNGCAVTLAANRACGLAGSAATRVAFYAMASAPDTYFVERASDGAYLYASGVGVSWQKQSASPVVVTGSPGMYQLSISSSFLTASSSCALSLSGPSPGAYWNIV